MGSKKIWTGESIRALAKARLKESEAQPAKISFSTSHESLEMPAEPETDEDAGFEVVDEEGKRFKWGQFQESAAHEIFLVVPYGDPDSGDEMIQLCKTLGLKFFDKLCLTRNQKINPASYLGQGMLEKIAEKIAPARHRMMLVIDAPLSPAQVRNLESFLEIPVVDREGIILAIFERHAQSRLAKTQVQLAQLKYLQPRLTGLWMGLSRQRGGRGGFGGRGQGETRLELDRRVIKERIATLTKKLKEAEKSLEVQSKKRALFPRVALVGYTNAGKSSLMNSLSGENLLAENVLFSTLDTTVRVMIPPSVPKILVSDTVGFVRDLPHGLIASFKSTLREALESQLIIQVLDLSSPNWEIQFETTEAVLKEIGAEEIPKILVLNKIDLLRFATRRRILDVKLKLQKNPYYSLVVALSAVTGEGVENLKEQIRLACQAELPVWSQPYHGSK